MFPNAKGMVVTGGTFTMQGEFHTHNYIVGSNANDGRDGLRLLQEKISPGAFHNSDERYDPPKCHPRTRQAILKKIMEWVKDPDKLAQFLWLYGPAGTGKSAIAQTIAEMCYEAGLLAAAFFFSRTAPGRNNKTHLITTLVYQLILCIPEMRERVGKVLEYNPVLLSMSLKAQIQALLVKPLNEVQVSDEEKYQQILKTRPRFIIIDGLDECSDAQSQTYILDVLSEATEQLSIPFFFLIASRPEQQIRDSFNEDLLASLTTTIVLNDTYQPDADIRIFLESKFQDIKRKHPSRARFPVPWPSERDIQRLVEKSSGQFIYISTVMKYLESRRHLPTERLQIVFGLTKPGSDTPFAELDALYHHIFSSVGDIDKIIELFCVLLLAPRSTVKKTATLIGDFLFYKPGEIDIILSDLHSIIAVPPPDDTKSELRISHASLGDFLLDRSRSGQFFVDAGLGHTKITTLLIKHIDSGGNIRDLSTALHEHSLKSHPTTELLDVLYEFDVATFLNWLSQEMTPQRANMPKMSWSKVPLENRWPNIPVFLFWLQKHRHPDPQKDLFQHYLDGFDNWLHTQLALYPQELGTTRLLTGVTFTAFKSFHSEIFDIINNGTNWDPTDVPIMKRIDPIHFFDIYYGTEHSKYYYTAISEFLMDSARAGPYYVDGGKFAAFAKLLLEFILAQDLNDKKRWQNHPNVALDILPLALLKASKTSELAAFLSDHTLTCSDPEYSLYKEINTTGDAIKAYLREYAQSRENLDLASNDS
ncbi:hypothetical protein BDZ97DRAFT_1227999 [Flammula alnicola]|nr:hypothetical protein BDZ97DRAFT_1227999 [Flammula alnicola]